MYINVYHINILRLELNVQVWNVYTWLLEQQFPVTIGNSFFFLSWSSSGLSNIPLVAWFVGSVGQPQQETRKQGRNPSCTICIVVSHSIIACAISNTCYVWSLTWHTSNLRIEAVDSYLVSGVILVGEPVTTGFRPQLTTKITQLLKDFDVQRSQQNDLSLAWHVIKHTATFSGLLSTCAVDDHVSCTFLVVFLLGGRVRFWKKSLANNWGWHHLSWIHVNTILLENVHPHFGSAYLHL